MYEEEDDTIRSPKTTFHIIYLSIYLSIYIIKSFLPKSIAKIVLYVQRDYFEEK